VVASGNIDLKGIRAPEECILGKNYTWFLEELEKKNIYIKEKLSPSEADAQPVEEIVRLN
jgi:hypothetical protein